MSQDLFTILNRDKIKNLACIGFFSNYPVNNFFIKNNSAIIFGKSDHLWAHISSSSPEELKSLLLKHHNRTKYYFSVEDWMIQLISEFGESDWTMTTNRYILTEDKNIDSYKLKLSQIDFSLAGYIYKNSDYQKYTSLKYIEDRLKKDISAGIWIDNELVAWGFTHDDGALGFLNVVKDFRKNGYGIKILKHLVRMRRDKSKSVFLNIVPENLPAINLVTKIGFSFDRRVSWIKLK